MKPASLTLTSGGAWIALAAVTVVAFDLRFDQVGHSLWLDELHSSWTIWDGAGHVAARARLGNQSPAWFYLVEAVTRIVPRDERGLRAVSLAVGTLLVPAAGLLVYVWTRSGAGMLAAAAIVAGDRTAIFYAQDARPYACVQLVALVHLAVLSRLTQCGAWPWRLAWIALAWLGFHVHYTFALLLAGQWVYLVLPLRWTGRGESYGRLAAAIDGALAALAVLPVWSHVREIAAHRGAWAAFINPRLSFEWLPWDLVSIFPLWLALGPGLVVVTLLAQKWPFERGSADTRRALGLVGVWYAVPVVVAWLATYFDVARLFYERYLAALAMGPALLAGLIVSLVRDRLAQGAFVVAAIAAMQLSPDSAVMARRAGHTFGAHDREDWRAAIAYIREHDPQGQATVLVDAGLIEAGRPIVRDYLLLPVNNIYELRQPDRCLLPIRLDSAEDLAAFVQGAAVPHAELPPGEGAPRSTDLFLLRRGPVEIVLSNAGELSARLKAADCDVELFDSKAWPGMPGVAVARLRLGPPRH